MLDKAPQDPEHDRIGVIGGTFDPPHYAHLVLAENGLVQLGLERVLFVPAGQPPHKPGEPITAVDHRIAMLEIALKGNEGFSLSLVDVERPGPHYTVDMLSILHDRHPAATLFFLMGGDSLAEFTTWRDPANILQQARLGVMQRPGSQTELASLEKILPGISERLMWLDAPHLEISGTDLRRRVSEGLPIRYLTPPAVEAYIDRHSLYAAGGARPSRSHLAHDHRGRLDHGAA